MNCLIKTKHLGICVSQNYFYSVKVSCLFLPTSRLGMFPMHEQQKRCFFMGQKHDRRGFLHGGQQTKGLWQNQTKINFADHVKQTRERISVITMQMIQSVTTAWKRLDQILNRMTLKIQQVSVHPLIPTRVISVTKSLENQTPTESFRDQIKNAGFLSNAEKWSL